MKFLAFHKDDVFKFSAAASSSGGQGNTQPYFLASLSISAKDSVA